MAHQDRLNFKSSNSKRRVKVISIVYAALLLAGAFSVLLPSASASVSYYVNSNWDAGTLDGWHQQIDAPTYSTDQAHSGSYSLKCVDGSGPSLANKGIISAAVGGLNVSLWVYPHTSQSGNWAKIIGFYDSGRVEYRGPLLLLTGTMLISKNQTTNAYENLFDLEMGRWNHVEIEIMAWDLFNIRLDEGTWLTNLHSYHTGTGVPTLVECGSMLANAKIYFDDYQLMLGNTWSSSGVVPLGNINSIPVMMAFTNKDYWYDFNVTGDSLVYDIDTNATFLTVDVDEGNITNTSAPEVGWYYVRCSVTNGTATEYQNYTLYVQALTGGEPALGEDDWAGYGSSFYDPVTNRIYYAWQGETTLDPVVKYYNLTSEAWSASYVCGVNTLSGDGHGSPYIMVDHDGYIHVTYGTHSDIQPTQKYSRSTNPNDISTWTNRDASLSGAYQPTYGCLREWWNSVRADYDVYFFYRTGGSGAGPEEAYMYSQDGGATFSASATFITSTSNNRWIYALNPEKVHLSYWSNGVFFIQWHTYTDSDTSRWGMYVSIFNPANGHNYNMTGYDLGTSLSWDTERLYCALDDSISYQTQIDPNDNQVYSNDYEIVIGWTSGTLTASSYNVAVYNMTTHAWKTYNFGSTAWLSGRVTVNGYSGTVLYVSVDVWTTPTATVTGTVLWHKSSTDPNFVCDGWIWLTHYYGNPLLQGWSSQSTQGLEQCFALTEISGSGANGYVYLYDTFGHQFVIDDVTIDTGLSGGGGSPVDITSSPVTSGYVNVSYSYQVVATGTGMTYSFHSDAGWLSIDPLTGLLNGTPTASGSFYVNVTVTSGSYSDYQNYTLTILPASFAALDDMMDIMIALIPLLLLLLLMVAVVGSKRRME